MLYACEAHEVPDLQAGNRCLLLVLELILHTLGTSGTLPAASRATRTWWMAGFEDGELTPIIWEAPTQGTRSTALSGGGDDFDHGL